MTVDAPVFVIGTGRCGSTALMDLIAYHEAFAWPSQYTDRWPDRPEAAALSRIVDLPIFNSRWKFLPYVPKHAECYRSWTACFAGFSEPFRDLVADDVTPRARREIGEMVGGVVRHQRKTRFITKYTGWSRIGFVKSVFPDAKFIHIVRDGRAVAYSYTTVPWWDGWGGVERSRWAIKDPKLLERWEDYDRSFVALAALQWKTLIDNLTDASAELPAADLLLVKYEDLVRDPAGAASACITFCGLDDRTTRFTKHLASAVPRIVRPEDRPGPPPWRQNLSEEQIATIEDLCAEELAWLGYE